MVLLQFSSKHASLENGAACLQLLRVFSSLPWGPFVLNASKTSLIGPTTDFVKGEILRVGAPLAEIRSAMALVGSGAALDPHAYDALSPRMRRLVDLLAVAGHKVAASICETSETACAGF